MHETSLINAHELLVSMKPNARTNALFDTCAVEVNGNYAELWLKKDVTLYVQREP